MIDDLCCFDYPKEIYKKVSTMPLKKLFQVLIAIQLLFTLNLHADTCVNFSSSPLAREGIGSVIASTETVHLEKVTHSTLTISDAVDVKFWVEKCVNENKIEYSLFANIQPSVLGKSKGGSYYDIATIQNNAQSDGFFYFTDNLYVGKDFWMGLYTWYKVNESEPYLMNGDLDLSKPFTLILSCSSVISHTNCSNINPDKIFEINPQSNNNPSSITSVNGLWYDPEFNGSGFNVIQSSAGLSLYFYGYKHNSNGEALWLSSTLGPKDITKGESFELTMLSGYLGNGGSLLDKPNTPNSGTQIWGTAEVTFDGCNTGEITLTNNENISVTHNITLLAAVESTGCQD